MTEDKANNNTILHTQFLKGFNTPEAARKISDPIGQDTVYNRMLQDSSVPSLDSAATMGVNNDRVDPHR